MKASRPSVRRRDGLECSVGHDPPKRIRRHIQPEPAVEAGELCLGIGQEILIAHEEPPAGVVMLVRFLDDLHPVEPPTGALLDEERPRLGRVEI